jgi:urease accessory protein
MRNVAYRLLVVGSTLVPTAALAHSGHGETAGFAHGFMHPLGGLDHVLAMVAVGMLAYRLGGRALWLVPSAFLLVMGIGAALGAAGTHLPLVEVGIAASIMVLGAAIALDSKAPLAIAAAVAGVFAVFHGYAHGAGIPHAGSAASYAVGFMTATALLHMAGIGLGLMLGRLGQAQGNASHRVAGCLIAASGVVILTQIV